MTKRKTTLHRISCMLLSALLICSFSVEQARAVDVAPDFNLSNADDPQFKSDNNIEFTCGAGDSAEDSAPGDTATAGEYIAEGNIPEGGKDVGASVFGGKMQGGKWVANWADNGGNDLGNTGNHLTGTTSFAELGTGGAIGNALGKLPNGTKLEIEVKSTRKKIIAVKADVGTGGPDVNGHTRAVDLWWEAANLLGLKDGLAVVTIHVVPKNTPVTPLSGSASTGTGSSEGGGGDSMCCAEGASASGDGTLIGKTNEEKIWNFLRGHDGNIPANDALSPEQAAGLMGNLKAESGYNPGSVEKANGIGFGIAQWSYGRRTSLEKAAKKKGVPVSDLAFQLKYLYEESKSRTQRDGSGNEWAGMRQQKTVEDAVFYWEHNYERSADSKSRVVQTRGGFAKTALKHGKKFDAAAPSGGGGSGSTAATSGGGKPVIFLDPGHGGNIPDYTDQKSGLITNETNNGQEDKDVLDVAKRIKSQLGKEGYQVVLSRDKNNTSAAQTPKFRTRADAAAAAKAAIGISIHTSPGGPNDAWSQKVGTFRERRDGSHRDTFKEKDTATKSQAYASAIAKARTEAEGHKVGLDSDHAHQTASFGRGGNIKSPGNIPLVALWPPKVPWVYNEIAQDKGTGLSEKRKTAYAKGIIEGIKAAGITGKQGGECGEDVNTGGLTGFILKYAWPTYHAPPYTKLKGSDKNPITDYAAAVKKAQKEGRYVGGGSNPGVDCGGFVTLLMTDSGFEPGYNYKGRGGPTTSQQAWMEKNWKKLGNGASMKVGGDCDKCLKLGDVAINSSHTFMFSGKDIPGFKTPTGVASASYSTTGASWRAPMAGREQPVSGNYTWYRKK